MTVSGFWGFATIAIVLLGWIFDIYMKYRNK